VNGAPPTIYDVAASAGVSIASVSRVLNGTGSPRADTRERVLRAVAELGFVPDGAARALSVKLKETVGVVYRRVSKATSAAVFAEEDENLQFADIINRGIEVAAQRSGFSLLISSVAAEDADAGRRMLALAGKCDGLIVHDLVLDSDQLDRLGRQIPVVNLAGITTPHTASVRGDSETGMRDLMRHLTRDHGYRTLGYLAGVADSPDNVTRRAVVRAEARAAGAELADGPEWQGSYYADGGASVVDALTGAGRPLPRAIVCANDLAAVGALHALARHGVDVPGSVAVTGFDDIPVARRLRPRLTTVRQPIQELGATAFELLESLVRNRQPEPRDMVLPTQLIRRESCGCLPEARLTSGVPADGQRGGLAEHQAPGRGRAVRIEPQAR
jgi:LacI family transcriptional regulator